MIHLAPQFGQHGGNPSEGRMDEKGIFMLGMLGLLHLLFGLVFFSLAALGTVFWIWMLVECAMKETNQGNEKLVWILIILFTHWIGAAIYYFVRRPKRIA